MKKIRNNFLIYFITASVLISGNGIVLAMHTCLSSASKDISFFNEPPCCSKKNKSCNSDLHKGKHENVVASKCCTSEVAYHKINALFLPQKSLSIPSFNLICFSLFSYNLISNCESIDHGFISLVIPLTLPFTHQQLLI